MNVAHEQHLQKIKDTFLAAVDKKYRAGQAEHGGNLWLKPGMLDNAIDEVVDLVVYLFTLRDQLTAKPDATYDEHQQHATLFQCTLCSREWYHSNGGGAEHTICFACLASEGR